MITLIHAFVLPKRKLPKLIEGGVLRPSVGLCRRLRAMKVMCPDTTQEAHDMLDNLLGRYLDYNKSLALKTWKMLTKGWTVQSSGLYLFLKNTEPRKALVLSPGEGVDEVSSDPLVMDSCLRAFWDDLESWSYPGEEDEITHILDDHYAICLASFPFDGRLSTNDLLLAAQKAKNQHHDQTVGHHKKSRHFR